MPFTLFQRGSLADQARQFKLATYTPVLAIEGLSTGVDNVRTDVYLSPRFSEVTRQHVAKLISKYGTIEQLLTEEFSTSSAPSPPRPPAAPNVKPPGPMDFKKAVTELQVAALNQAKADNNIAIDLLLRVAVLKFLRTEFSQQYGQLLERCRTKLKGYEGPRQMHAQKGVELRELFASFQVNKKAVLRKVGQDVFQTMREAEKETLARTRRSLLGDQGAAQYDLLMNRLLFTADGRDDFLNAEQYVLMGNYASDPDRFETLHAAAVEFLASLEFEAESEETGLDPYLCVPENAQELLGGGIPDDSPRGKAQRTLLNAWVGALEETGVMDQVVAAYETAGLLAQYSPPINPQQLKNSLINKAERKRVESLLHDHGKTSTDNLQAAVKRVEGCKGADLAKVAGRFFGDLIRYTRDLRRFESVTAAADGINVIANERMRELSAINNTLYEFKLPEEQKPAEEKVTGHVILKADIRDSTTLTRTLFERGLNPASYFSLNFYDPVNKLLPKYEAMKVFIEGDAVILALFEREGEQNLAVARTCVLAKEMIQIVRGYNEQSEKSGLPTLELGIGICFQDSAPMYLMDGTSRIMISKALNLSDRLSSCGKGARKFVDAAKTAFNVYSFQTVEDADTVGNPDEFLVRYNVGGINIDQAAFEKLRTEISLWSMEASLPSVWEQGKVHLHAGLVPVGSGSFHSLVMREGTMPHLDARDSRIKAWTTRKYYEVCTNPTVYEYVENKRAAAAGSSGD